MGKLLPLARSAKGHIGIQVFRPAGATRCTDFGKIWHGGAWVGA